MTESISDGWFGVVRCLSSLDAEMVHFGFGESMAFARVSGTCTGNSPVSEAVVFSEVIVFIGRSGRI